MNNSAFPQKIPVLNDCMLIGHEFVPGLTKREYFAAKAIQGLATKLIYTADYKTINFEAMASSAVQMAEALIAELAKPETKP